LLMLENKSKESIDHLFNIEDIGEAIIEALMLDKKFDEETASKIFYSSGIFAQLADESTGFYKKKWQEIYELLKQELNLINAND